MVCHAEGVVIAGPDTDTTGYHIDGIIDLYDADDLGTVYSYDKDAVASSAGAAEFWQSGNAVWRTQTSTTLDPFCLTCHDADGAVASAATNDGGNAGNPFGDLKVTNDYDQTDRGVVTDIASKVVCGDAVLPAEGTPCSILPPDGLYSHHAIRGQSTSRYSTSQIPASYWKRDKHAWDDTKVMGCADCHTTDGSNGTTGNAHGSVTEYLRKDIDGLTNEGTYDKPSSTYTYGCYACHSNTEYTRGGGHAGSDSDYINSSGIIGKDPRLANDGNLYGNACTNCHGGIGFGSIHGSSQDFGIGEDGNAFSCMTTLDCDGSIGVGAWCDGSSCRRYAYRFTNGASLRFFDPTPWDQTSGQGCFTLGAGDATWGGCAKHNGMSPATRSKEFARPLTY